MTSKKMESEGIETAGNNFHFVLGEGGKRRLVVVRMLFSGKEMQFST